MIPKLFQDQNRESIFQKIKNIVPIVYKEFPKHSFEKNDEVIRHRTNQKNVNVQPNYDIGNGFGKED